LGLPLFYFQFDYFATSFRKLFLASSDTIEKTVSPTSIMSVALGTFAWIPLMMATKIEPGGREISPTALPATLDFSLIVVSMISPADIFFTM